MRQRKVKNLDAKYEEYNDILIREPADMKGRWLERSAGLPVYLEIGCGKGKFISEMAARHPGRFFAAVEGNQSVMLRAMEKASEYQLKCSAEAELKGIKEMEEYGCSVNELTDEQKKEFQTIIENADVFSVAKEAMAHPDYFDAMQKELEEYRAKGGTNE
jgi:hypothetical protein